MANKENHQDWDVLGYFHLGARIACLKISPEEDQYVFFRTTLGASSEVIFTDDAVKARTHFNTEVQDILYYTSSSDLSLYGQQKASSKIPTVLAYKTNHGDSNAPIPWNECLVSFDFDGDPDSLYHVLTVSTQYKLPHGWTLSETDESGTRTTVVFRIEGVLPSIEDGMEVQQLLQDIAENFNE